MKFGQTFYFILFRNGLHLKSLARAKTHWTRPWTVEWWDNLNSEFLNRSFSKTSWLFKFSNNSALKHPDSCTFSTFLFPFLSFTSTLFNQTSLLIIVALLFFRKSSIPLHFHGSLFPHPFYLRLSLSLLFLYNSFVYLPDIRQEIPR